MQTSLIAKPLLIIGLYGVLQGCASSSDRYPSLALRDAERMSTADTAAAPAPQAVRTLPLDDEQIRTIDQAVEHAQAQHEIFLQDLPEAVKTIEAAQGKGPSDNAWAAAQVALADLASLHGESTGALSDLDALMAQAITQSADTEAISTARERVENIILEQKRAISQLRQTL